MTRDIHTTDKRIGLAQRVDLGINRAAVEWVPTSEVLPNPLNPRKDDSVKTDLMQNVLRTRGWEEPLTVYKKGRMYVLLAGHRRYYAARQMSLKQVPVYVVDAPTSHQNEIERIASLQSAKQDWEPFEWARFTYERWIAWGQPPIAEFAKQIGLSKAAVESYIDVLGFFPVDEIQGGLRSKAFNMSLLHEITRWYKVLTKTHPDLIEALTEDMIRRTLLNKAENKLVTRESLRKVEFLKLSNDETVKNFLMSQGEHLEQHLENVNLDVKEKTFHGVMISLGYAKKSVVTVAPKTVDQAIKSAEALLEIKKKIDKQLKEIEKKFPDTVEKDRLF